MARRKISDRAYISRISDEGDVDVYEFKFNPTIHSREILPEWNFQGGVGQYVPIGQYSKIGSDIVEMVLFLTAIGDYKKELKGCAADMAMIEEICAVPDVEGVDIDNQMLQFKSPALLQLYLGYPQSAIYVRCTRCRFTVRKQNKFLHPMVVDVDLAFRRVSKSLDDNASYVSDLKDLARGIILK